MRYVTPFPLDPASPLQWSGLLKKTAPPIVKASVLPTPTTVHSYYSLSGPYH